MSEIRQAAVAGTFYPADPALLSQSVDQMLASARQNVQTGVQKAIIAPHAGHVYSGPIAANLYVGLENKKNNIKRVVLLGPSHRIGFRGIAACTSDSYQTPLGLIDVDKTALESVISLPNVGYLDEAHKEEHSLEVHLPFLQRTLTQFKLVPLVVGDADKQDVARVLEKLWGGLETLIVISSDLSHFHNYSEAQQIDENTSRKILNLEPNLTGDEACGCRPINGLLQLAKQKGLSIQEVDVRNSGDTAGSHDRVVGYGAYVIFAAETEQSTPISIRQQIIQVARQAILQPFQSKEKLNINFDLYADELREDGASFITLNLGGRLRGCIGSLEAYRALILDVAHNAQAAAFKDPRFSPLTLEEYRAIELHASILSKPQPLDVDSKEALLEIIRPGRDGIILDEGGRRATYLPSVWQQLPDPEMFIRELRRKAGLNPDQWNQCQVMRYTTEEFV
jgi:hypothetical protein